jgi:hypothetical protein
MSTAASPCRVLMASIKHCQLNLLCGLVEQAQGTVQKLLVLACCKLNNVVCCAGAAASPG